MTALTAVDRNEIHRLLGAYRTALDNLERATGDVTNAVTEARGIASKLGGYAPVDIDLSWTPPAVAKLQADFDGTVAPALKAVLKRD